MLDSDTVYSTAGAAAYGAFAADRFRSSRVPTNQRRLARKADHNRRRKAAVERRARQLYHMGLDEKGNRVRGDGVTAYRMLDDNGRTYYVGIVGGKNCLRGAFREQAPRLAIPRIEPFRARPYTRPEDRRVKQAPAELHGVDAAEAAEAPDRNYSHLAGFLGLRDDDHFWRRLEQRIFRKGRMAVKRRRGW